MKTLINEVYDLIKDYREGENLMSVERVTTWINQFNEEDRQFVLEEMKHILKQRYISKERAHGLVDEMIEFLTDHFKCTNPKEFLLSSYFIDHQPEGKSQKELLHFLADILIEKYGINIKDCSLEKAKFYVYFDDVLCTGDTLFKGLAVNNNGNIGWFHWTNDDGRTNLDLIKQNNGKLVLAYFAIHDYNIKKTLKRIYFGLNKHNLDWTYAWDENYKIENDPTDGSAKLNLVYPKESVIDDFVTLCQTQIENKIHNTGYHAEETIKYRPNGLPKDETLFSSPANRDRFEKIILDKCIEIYNTSDSLKNNPRAKPLGYGLYSDLSLGFGALIFTWRNVPFNVPLVFWYKSQHWTSLFERKFVNYEH